MYTGIIDSTSNRADWEEAFVLVDNETGETIDISHCRITVTVAKIERQPNYNGCGVRLTGSTDTGEITLPDVGTFKWLFTQDRMASLQQGEYQIGVRISQDARTVQLIIGAVNVIEGIDQQ